MSSRETAPPRPITILLIATLFLLGACFADRRSAPQPTATSTKARATATRLRVATPLERNLVGGETHIYEIDLTRGQYLHLVVEQMDVDLVVSLHGPARQELLRADGLTGNTGQEAIFWVARTAGLHRIDLKTLNEQGSGRYRIDAQEIRTATPTDEKRAAAQWAYAEAKKLRGLEAIRGYQDSLALWEELGDLFGQANSLYRIALVHRDHLAQHRRAIVFCERALKRYEAIGSTWLQASVLHNLGRAHYYLGEMEPALKRYKNALGLWQQVKLSRREAQVMNNMAIIYELLGEPQQALVLYEQALEQWQRQGNPGEEATVLHNRGKSYFFLGQPEQALEDLSRALKLRQELGNPRQEASTQTAIGLVHEYLGQMDPALRSFKAALKLRRETGDRRGEAVTLSTLGRVYDNLGDESLALESFRQALPIFRSLDDQRQEAWGLLALGSLLEEKDLPRALDHYRRALPLFESAKQLAGVVMARENISKAERASGRNQEARRQIEKAIEAIETTRAKPASLVLRSSYFATKQGHYDFYIDLLMELHRGDPSKGHATEALVASERARARSQLDALSESDTDLLLGTDPALRTLHRQLEKRINAKELQRLRFLEDRESPHTVQLETIERELSELLRRYEQVRGQIRLSSPRFALLTQPDLIDAESIQKQVTDDDTLLLEYKLGEPRSFVWAVTRQHIDSFELPGRAQIEKTARRTYALLSSGHRRESRAPTRLALQHLSNMLIAPIAHLLEDKRLLIVSEGALQYIPFAALPLRDGTLLAEHEINMMPSVSTLAELRRHLAGRPKPPGLVAVLADPVFQSHDPRLPRPDANTIDLSSEPGLRNGAELKNLERLIFSGQEAKAILSLVPPARSFQALGFAANRQTVLNGELGQYQILHFATHGDLNSAHPELSRLVFSLLDEKGRARDGFLHAHEVYNLELPAELVVLSACHTAIGQQIRGEGLVGLTQAFMYAGAARVVVSLWQVNDAATANLMKSFYEHHLVHGLRPSSALRQAQLSTARQANWREPYYWSAFVIQGEW